MSTPLYMRDHLKLDTIFMMDEAVLEINYDYDPIVWVPREEVKSIRLRYASTAERPMAAIIGGIALCLLALSPLVLLAAIYTYGGQMNTMLFGLCGFAVAGVWMLYTALRRRLFLEVATATQSRNLIFRGDVSPQEAEEFLLAAGKRYGYWVMSEL